MCFTKSLLSRFGFAPNQEARETTWSNLCRARAWEKRDFTLSNESWINERSSSGGQRDRTGSSFYKRRLLDHVTTQWQLCLRCCTAECLGRSNHSQVWTRKHNHRGYAENHQAQITTQRGRRPGGLPFHTRIIRCKGFYGLRLGKRMYSRLFINSRYPSLQ